MAGKLGDISSCDGALTVFEEVPCPTSDELSASFTSCTTRRGGTAPSESIWS